MAIWVTGRPDNTSHSLAVDTHKVVGVGSGLHSVNSNTDTSIGTVLESDGEGGTRS
jgi:hypothetical protein